MGGRQVLNERGSVTVELFLVIPLVFFVLVAGLQVVSVARMRVELQGAVREGARVAATTPDPSRAVAAVLDALDPAMADRTRVTVTRPTTPGKVATVGAIYSHLVDLPIFPDLSVDISAMASMLTEK